MYTKFSIGMKALDAGPEEESMESREKRLGIGKRTIRYFWGEEDAETTGNGSGLWWKNDVRNFRVLDLRNETEIPRSGRAVFGIEFLSLCVDVPRYLEILMEQAISLGARIVRKRIETRDGLEGVIMDAKRIIMDSWEERKTPECFVALINCTGLSAGDFVTKEEAKNLYPIRGQTVLVKGEARMGRSYTKIPDTSEQEVVYVIPRPGSGTTILGGCKQPGIWDGEVDPHLTERILERVKREGLAEELRTGKGGEFEVISAQVGLRPGRRGGPRVELDSNDQVQQTWIIHAYGHAGAGYQSSIGSAQKVVRIINKLRI